MAPSASFSHGKHVSFSGRLDRRHDKIQQRRERHALRSLRVAVDDHLYAPSSSFAHRSTLLETSTQQHQCGVHFPRSAAHGEYGGAKTGSRSEEPRLLVLAAIRWEKLRCAGRRAAGRKTSCKYADGRRVDTEHGKMVTLLPMLLDAAQPPTCKRTCWWVGEQQHRAFAARGLWRQRPRCCRCVVALLARHRRRTNHCATERSTDFSRSNVLDATSQKCAGPSLQPTTNTAAVMGTGSKEGVQTSKNQKSRTAEPRAADERAASSFGSIVSPTLFLLPSPSSRTRVPHVVQTDIRQVSLSLEKFIRTHVRLISAHSFPLRVETTASNIMPGHTCARQMQPLTYQWTIIILAYRARSIWNPNRSLSCASHPAFPVGLAHALLCAPERRGHWIDRLRSYLRRAISCCLHAPSLLC
nr:unnamed protein product [Digitaria exilis]